MFLVGLEEKMEREEGCHSHSRGVVDPLPSVQGELPFKVPHWGYTWKCNLPPLHLPPLPPAIPTHVLSHFTRGHVLRVQCLLSIIQKVVGCINHT